MLSSPIRTALVALAASAGLTGCTSLGPYGGASVGYGSYGYDPYYSGYPYGYAGYGYGYDPFGWYNGFYYPGTGFWVYDRNHRRRELTPEERAYWNARIEQYVRDKRGLNGPAATSAIKENWSSFNRPRGTTNATTASPTISRDAIRQRVLERQQSLQQARSEGAEARSERSESRQESSHDQPRVRRRPR